MISVEEFAAASSQFAVLSRLDAEHQEALRRAAMVVNAASGKVLFDAGDECEGLGLVILGRIKVSVVSASGRELVLYRVHPGETCTVTASCLVGDTIFPARGTVEEDLTAVALPRAHFHSLLDCSRVFRSFVFTIFSDRVTALMKLVNEVAFNHLDRRLADRLLELGPVVTMTHQELADDLGTSREMVSRLLQALADDSAVALGRRRIEVRRPERLAQSER